MASTAAGIVAFAPKPHLLFSLIETLRADAVRVFVFVNAVIDPQVRARLDESGAEVIESPFNLGVAEGLNILALAATLAGAPRLALFDQDSQPPPGMVARLNQALDRLRTAGQTPALVGPRIAAPADEVARFKPPRYFPAPGAHAVEGLAPVRYLITSGSLLDLGAFRAIGRFRSDFFIDAIDTEYCFRAWSKGFSCWCDPDLSMPHRIGEGVMGRPWLGPPIPRQRPFRLYSYVRNQAYCLRLAHIPWDWRVRSALHVVRVAIAAALEPDGLALARSVRAFADGLAGRLGPPPGAAFTARLDR